MLVRHTTTVSWAISLFLRSGVSTSPRPSVCSSRAPTLLWALTLLHSCFLWLTTPHPFRSSSGLQRDARSQGVMTVQDWGMLAFIFWPVMIPWYAIKTRGLGVGMPLAAFLLLPVLAPPVT